MSVSVELFFLLFRLDSFLLDVNADERVQAHVYIGHPHECESCNKVSPPSVHQQRVPGDDQHQNSYVVAETIFAREQVEQLSDSQRLSIPALPHTIFAGLPKDLLMRYGPRDTGDGYGENKQPDDLRMYLHKYERYNQLLFRVLANR